MDTLWLKSTGLSHADICCIVGISNTTLCKYLKIFLSGGVEKLREINFYAPTSELEQHRQQLEAYFREHPPATAKEAMARIEELTGIKRSVSTVGRFLTSLGMRPRKVGAIPSKADPEKQEYFKNKELNPRLDEAKQGKRLVFFVDAAHFVLAPLLGIVWSFARLFIQAPAGRKRFNVLGALNAITHELILVTNDTYINAQSVCELLHKISLLGAEVAITLVLDNARYQKCKVTVQPPIVILAGKPESRPWMANARPAPMSQCLRCGNRSDTPQVFGRKVSRLEDKADLMCEDLPPIEPPFDGTTRRSGHAAQRPRSQAT